MPRSLVVAELVDGELSSLTAEAVTAAAGLGGEVVLALVAHAPDELVEAGSLAGVTEIVTVEAPGSDRDHEQMVQAVTALVTDVQPSVVLAGFSIRATAYAPAVAQALDLGLASDVVEVAVDGAAVRAVRSIYDGRVHAQLEFPTGRPVFVLVRGAVWAPAEPAAAPRTRALSVQLTPSKVRSLRVDRPSGDLDLTRSNVILSVGRGVGGQENVAIFADVAARLGVGLGASRPIIDAGWLPAVHQVGLTGVTVKPKLYIALGISGALHHLAGIQGSQTIVAVNTDKDAPIFAVADFGAVVDIHELAEQLLTKA